MDSVWVARDTSYLTALAREFSPVGGNRRLLVLAPIREVRHHVLSAWFRHIVAPKNGISLLPPKELLEVLQAANRNALLIGAGFDARDQVIILYRGSVDPIVVPLEWFRERHGGAGVDPGKIRVIDHGRTVKFGDRQAGSDAILYAFDEEYRRSATGRLADPDQSLGGSIRRLRVQSGLTQHDFAPLPARTIGRVERGDVSDPRGATLKAIAKRLNVAVESLGSY